MEKKLTALISVRKTEQTTILDVWGDIDLRPGWLHRRCWDRVSCQTFKRARPYEEHLHSNGVGSCGDVLLCVPSTLHTGESG